MDAFSFSFALQSEACLRAWLCGSNDFDAIGYDVYINCGYTDTILIVYLKKYTDATKLRDIYLSSSSSSSDFGRSDSRCLSSSLFARERSRWRARGGVCGVGVFFGRGGGGGKGAGGCPPSRGGGGGGGGGVTCRRHISSRSPRNRPRTSSASNRTNWLPFYLRRAVLSPLSKSPSRLVPNTFSRF